MRLPAIRGLIERRLLINYRVDPSALAAFLPPPFRPRTFRGVGVAGICLIRLRQIRPTFLPGWVGVSSENVAHRVAVEWEEAGSIRQGVYIPRRDTDSRLNAWAGGRLFPGVHHRARFTVDEHGDRLEVALESDDGRTRVSVCGRRCDRLPPSSIFGTLEAASDFFEVGSVGYSPTSRPSRFQGVELRCLRWAVQPLAVAEVRSSFFEDPGLFPPGSIELDNALLMRNIEHEWHGRADLCCGTAARHPEPADAA